MDTVDPATDLPRYVAATRESGVWRQRPNGVWFNTGQYGYGRGIYINNALDIQQESRGFLGGYTLRGDWVNPGKSRYWNGPFYEPPGVFIELVEVLNPDGSVRAQGFRITRNQAEPRDVWYNPITGLPTNLKTMNFFFRNPNDPNDPTLTSEITQGDTSFDVPFNGVIYAEGNVRVKGRIPSGRQIIIVTNGTAYIEGNIVKGDERSALAILAKDYVCINTTQFLQRTFDSPASAQGDPTNVEVPYFFEVLPDQPMRLLFSFGEDPNQYTGNFGGLRLYLRHASSGAGSFINLLVNPSEFADPFYRFNIAGFPVVMYPLGRTAFQVYPNYEKVAFPLVPRPSGASYELDPRPGIVNLLQLQLSRLRTWATSNCRRTTRRTASARRRFNRWTSRFKPRCLRRRGASSSSRATGSTPTRRTRGRTSRSAARALQAWRRLSSPSTASRSTSVSRSRARLPRTSPRRWATRPNGCANGAGSPDATAAPTSRFRWSTRLRFTMIRQGSTR
jgi:hypothetical protein